MTSTPSFIVFSDLDGTLLDHGTYSWEAARPALDRLATLGVPVILASSKTASEMDVLQQSMGLSGFPAIVENGAGLIGLKVEAEPDSTDYQRIRDALNRLPTALRERFQGFGDMTVSEVSAATGLDITNAKRAKRRGFSEPGIWRGSDDDQNAFIAALGQEGLSARKGGRFLTLSLGATKADQMEHVLSSYAPAVSIALGDAPNDVEMLERADYGAIIHNPHSPPLPRLKGEDTARIRRTKEAGPKGWSEAIDYFLDRLGDRAHG
ncbi:MAG: HAD-IIB family hydrolase [Arenibacterium sp.]